MTPISDGDTPSNEEIVELAYHVALQRRLKYLTRKGRRISSGSGRRLLTGDARGDILSVLLDPLRQVEAALPYPAKSWTQRDKALATKYVWAFLSDALVKARRGPGRPRKSQAIIEHAMQSARGARGRPPLISAERSRNLCTAIRAYKMAGFGLSNQYRNLDALKRDIRRGYTSTADIERAMPTMRAIERLREHIPISRDEQTYLLRYYHRRRRQLPPL